MTGEKFACIRIIGRANFSSSIDFKTLINELRQTGFEYFVLELSECVLMDSTFLGVLAGFGLKLNQPDGGKPAIELLNPTPRITELLENLGVLHLFKLIQGPIATSCEPAWEHNAAAPSKEQVTLACLEAHHTLMEINPENVARFKDVAAFLAEDLKKLKGES
jgi:anti-anti-sigma regulatory factor